MRLHKIKMAGFKSFVDPTTIHIPSSMVGVVGPNGCGKSNIIDAVRWVMGESSRHIRGDSMEDVIFNGSSSRKPVGQASIELVFDNSEGRAGGQYAGFAEIAIRRQVSRDGQSKYSLNGSRCRRRDILDIFLGTGLGPRSYAIIEQGMISRLIEAKPEELRVHLEEAAGISKYKERRRETETRIRHARENIERLDDLREEIDKQLARLKRQARTAERYKELKVEEARVKGELLALRWRSLDAEAAGREKACRAAESETEKAMAILRAIESEVEKLREEQVSTQEVFNGVQAEFYRLGGEITRTEQSIRHAREQREARGRELESNRAEYADVEAERDRDRRRLNDLETRIGTREPELVTLRARQQAATEEYSRLEANVAELQQRWDELNRLVSEPGETAQAERARLEQLEGSLVRDGRREARLRDEMEGLGDDELLGEEETLAADASDRQQAAENARETIRTLLSGIESARESNRELNRRLNEERAAEQHTNGRLSSLETLQESALGKRQEGVKAWLGDCGLGEAPRLAEGLEVEPGWETAVETVLGQFLEAVCSDGLDAVLDSLGALERGNVVICDTARHGGTVSPAGGDTLAACVRAPWPLPEALRQVLVADDLRGAIALRGRLGPGQSVVTRAGLWLGPDWLRVVRDPDEHAGVLAREAEIRSLQTRGASLRGSIGELETELSRGREALSGLERSLHDAQADANQANRAHTEAERRLATLRSRLEQNAQRRERLEEELDEIADQQARHRADHAAARKRRIEALERIEALNQERDALAGERNDMQKALIAARESSRAERDAAHETALQLESLRTARVSTREGLERMTSRTERLERQREQLEVEMANGEAPLKEQAEVLEALLEQRVEVERSVTEARARVQGVDAKLREHDRRRAETEHGLDDLRSHRDRLRMEWQEARVRCETLSEQVREAGFGLDEVLAGLTEEAAEAEWQAEAEKLAARIGRLGPINLAAIDEFQEQSERKTYLDGQHADLTEALQTLGNAIHKIDRETRQRFRETFDRVNTRLVETFPRLFGGGQAHLEMTGDDLLSTGVSILARPPGKRLSNIHLMSGGEKALTAVALVFAIFELNPAPFCMLDEVDAPLDENNVARFAELVKAMSGNVQFIFITHNKTTMEYADQLVGVTMHEPGVSRMVAVDVDEAARMATG
ncbi:MAG: chromosome segregation protein SMC [Pseudomonadota bacterium]|nr:chromosome segregation protein SMC [Pseudomonadota bacterium]